MKNRSEIDDNLKWDLTKFCKNDEEFYKRLEKIEKQIPQFKNYEGKLSDDSLLFECLEKECALAKEFSLVATYAHLRLCEDNADRKANDMNEKVSFVSVKFSNQTAFIDVEVTKFSKKKLLELQSNEKFANYRRYFEGILRDKKHALSKRLFNG